MTRRVPAAVVAAAVVLATLTAPLALAAVESGTGAAASDAPGNASDAPGARLSGVLGSQGAALSGDLQRRSLDVALSRANSSNAKAAVVARSADSVAERLAELNATRETLRRRYENGSITRAEYHARLARYATQSETLRAYANDSARAADRLPDAALRRHGVERDRLRRLVHAAGNLSGPEVAAIARNVTGAPRGAGPSGHGGGPPAGVPGAGHGGGPHHGASGTASGTTNATVTGSGAGAGDGTDATARGNATAGANATARSGRR